MRSIKSGSHLYHHLLTLLANQNLFYCLFNWRFRRELRDFIFILLLLRLLISKPTWITILTPILIPLEILWLCLLKNSHNWRCVNSIQIKSSLRRTSPIPVCPISLTTTTTATSLRLSLSPHHHLTWQDATLHWKLLANVLFVCESNQFVSYFHNCPTRHELSHETVAWYFYSFVLIV